MTCQSLFCENNRKHINNLISVKLVQRVVKVNKNVFVCVEILRPSQPNGVMSSAVSLPNHSFTGQA